MKQAPDRNAFAQLVETLNSSETSDSQAFKRAIDMTDDELAAIVGRAKLTVV